MKVRLVILICLIEVVTFALHSCDTIETVKLPENPPKLVVNCIAQNTGLPNADLESYSDSLFTAYVSLSSGVLQRQDLLPQVYDAVVNLYENGTFLETLTWSPNFDPLTQGAYKSKKNSPKPGSTYQIEVIDPSYTTLTSSYTQPLAIMVDSIELKIIGPDPSYQSYTDLQVRIRFADPADEDYYELSITGKSDKVGGVIITSQFLGLSFVDPAYTKTNGIQLLNSGAVVFSDSFFNGKEAVLDLLATRPNPEITAGLSLKYYTVFLNHISKEYYLYLKTYLLQKQTEGDPYAQPVMVENNIQNGYGIFCGYTTTAKTVVFDK